MDVISWTHPCELPSQQPSMLTNQALGKCFGAPANCDLVSEPIAS